MLALSAWIFLCCSFLWLQIYEHVYFLVLIHDYVEAVRWAVMFHLCQYIPSEHVQYL